MSAASAPAGSAATAQPGASNANPVPVTVAGAITTARAALQTIGAEQVDRVAELEARRLQLMREKAEIVKSQKLEARKRKREDKKIQGIPTDNLLRMVGARLAAEAKALAKAKPRARARARGVASGVHQEAGNLVEEPPADEGVQLASDEDRLESASADPDELGSNEAAGSDGNQ